MGFLDWLFGRKKKPKQTKASPAPSAATAASLDDDDDEDDEDAAEATTFISRRLSPVAQREIKTLRDMLAQGVQDYEWQGEACNACKKFLTSGPFRVGDGLTGQAPVPGREGCAGEKCDCELVPADS